MNADNLRRRRREGGGGGGAGGAGGGAIAGGAGGMSGWSQDPNLVASAIIALSGEVKGLREGRVAVFGNVIL